MKYTNIPSAQSVVDHCKARGIKEIVISPGSRNAPLIIGFTEDPFFTCFSIVDERCAAFFALGMAQQQRRMVALVCTSGSALLNYYPAVAEAFYSHIPLLVLSADRPFYKVDIGDGQTIRQNGVFERHIGYSANLKQDIVHASEKIKYYAPQLLQGGLAECDQFTVQQFNDSELNNVFKLAMEFQLPVHVNIPFEEPLYGTCNTRCVNPCTEAIIPKIGTLPDDLSGFGEIWKTSARKMIVVGSNYPNTIEQHYLDRLANDPTVIVFTETTSNLHHPGFFPSMDSIIAPVEKSQDSHMLFESLKPDILLTFGGLIVSKKIKEFLRKYKPKHHWHVDSLEANDTFFALTHHFKMSASAFLSHVTSDLSTKDTGYTARWKEVRDNYQKKRKDYLKRIPFSDFWVFSKVIRAIPKNHQVHLANSSAVRYSQLFDMDKSLAIFCNRGTSGIDGSTSTAIGGAWYANTPTVLITGDLSFFYDSNGLWNNYMRPDFRVIMINNQGGGIFRILPGKEETSNFSTYFETKHDLDASKLCSMYGITYLMATSKEDLEREMEFFYQQSDRPKLMEIRTPRLLNDKVLLDYFDFLS